MKKPGVVKPADPEISHTCEKSRHKSRKKKGTTQSQCRTIPPVTTMEQNLLHVHGHNGDQTQNTSSSIDEQQTEKLPDQLDNISYCNTIASSPTASESQNLNVMKQTMSSTIENRDSGFYE